MLNTGDKIILTNEMGMFTNVGEVCEVVQVEDNGNIWFTFGNGMHLGCMSSDEFEKYFEVCEEPGHMTMDDAMAMIDESEVIVETVFDRCTVVCCKLPNDFVIVESSACLDPDAYSEQIGVNICRRKIAEKILELNAYKELDEQHDDYDYDDDYDCDDLCDDDCDDYDYCAHCSGCANNLEDTGHCDNDVDWYTRMMNAHNEIEKAAKEHHISDMNVCYDTRDYNNYDIMSRMGWRF